MMLGCATREATPETHEFGTGQTDFAGVEARRHARQNT